MSTGTAVNVTRQTACGVCDGADKCVSSVGMAMSRLPCLVCLEVVLVTALALREQRVPLVHPVCLPVCDVPFGTATRASVPKKEARKAEQGRRPITDLAVSAAGRKSEAAMPVKPPSVQGGAGGDALVLEHPHRPAGEDEGSHGRVRVGRAHHAPVPRTST